MLLTFYGRLILSTSMNKTIDQTSTSEFKYGDVVHTPLGKAKFVGYWGVESAITELLSEQGAESIVPKHLLSLVVEDDV